MARGPCSAVVHSGPAMDGRSGAQGRQSRGGGRGDGVGEPVMGLTGGRPMTRWLGDGGNCGGGRCAGERLAQDKREAKEAARRGGAVWGCSRWLLQGGGGSSCAGRRRGTGGGAPVIGRGGQWCPIKEG
jgi:hypothetical protein